MATPHAVEQDEVAALIEQARSHCPQASRRAVRAGETIVEEGDPAGSFFAILRGAVEVVRQPVGSTPRVVARMGVGELFGEMSLLSGAPRLATVVAAEDGELLELGRADLDAIAAHRPDAADVVHRLYRGRLLANLLRASPLFEELTEERRWALMEVVHLETYEAGSVIIPQGKPGRAFHVLLRGRCDVSHRAEADREESHPSMGEGDVFGEIALLQSGPTTATVRAATRCVVLALQSEWFDELLLRDPSARDRIYALAAERLDRTNALVARREIDHGLV